MRDKAKDAADKARRKRAAMESAFQLFSTKGIEFSMTALFIASFTEQWINYKNHIPALTGLGCTLLCLIIFGADRFMIPSMLLITLILTLIRGREEKAT